jgi:O-acetyl-ADP-ribose deacetylase (regulator of RNase III)
LIAFSLPPLTLEIEEGDLAAQPVDAVVNAANTAFRMGAGAAGALKARGGAAIETEAMAQGPVEPGECVVTAGHQLPAKMVVHAAVMGQDLRTSATFIAQATRNALRRADAAGATSMAFPALGTGVGGFPLADCAHIMIEAIDGYAATAQSLRLMRLVLFGRAAYHAFAEVAGERLGAPIDGPPDCPVSG